MLGALLVPFFAQKENYLLRRVGKQEGKEKRNMEKTGESQTKNPEENRTHQENMCNVYK